MALVLALLAVLLLAALVVVALLVWGRGTARPLVDAHGRPIPGSLSEKIHVRIGGMDQGMFIKSVDPRNPVLLFLHGYGMPGYWLTQWYPTGLERHFTVAWWEQRGACMSFRPDLPRETMTIERFITDTLEVTDYLRARFGVEKVYVMAHSWGTYLGIQTVARDPSKFLAYIGVAQESYQVRSEQLAWTWMLERYRERGDTKMVRALEGAPVTLTVPLAPAYYAIRDRAMHELGVGTMHEMKSVVTGLFLPSFTFREYTLRERVDLWRGKRFSRSTGLWDAMLATDLTRTVPELEIPAYFLHGIHDHTCSYVLAKDYVRQLRAPLVGFYSFARSAHSPMYEEPERTLRILTLDVLKGTNALADADEVPERGC